MLAQSTVTVVSAADYGPAVAPGSIAAAFGANLSNTHAAATLDANGNLPTTLQGTSVSVNGKPAGLFYVSPGQVNFVLPKDTATGNAVIAVTSPASAAPSMGSAQVQLAAPGIFTIACLRTDRGAVENGVTGNLEPFQATTPQNAITDKRTRLSVYGTGFRYADNPTRNDSTLPTSHVTAQIVDSNRNVFVTQVEYAGAQGVFFGLDQINVVLPPGTDGLGLVTLQLSVDGAPARPVTIVLAPQLTPAAQPGALSVVTVAGTGNAGSGGDGSAALLAQLRNPAGVAFDAKHNLYIADADNHVIRMVDPNGVASTFAGTGVQGYAGDNGPASAAQFRRPVALAFDSLGNLYVADADDHRVRRISGAGIVTTVAGTGSAGFSGDSGPAVSANLKAPGGIAVNSQGTLFIADTANNRVRRVTADGLISTVAGAGTSTNGIPPSGYLTPLSGPTDVSVDAAGNVVVADSGDFVIRRIGVDGTISTIAGAGVEGTSGTNCPALQAQFNSPLHVFMNSTGQLIVADTANQRIRIIDSNCNIKDAAGNGTPGFQGDGGSALQGEFNAPQGMAVDQLGNIYVADSANQRIRKLSLGLSPSFAFSPASVQSGQAVSGFLDLGAPGSAPTVIQFSSNASLPDLTSTLTIPPGQTIGVVTFTAPAVSSPTPVTIVATGPGVNVAGTLMDSPPPGSGLSADSGGSGSGSGGSGGGVALSPGSLTLGSLTFGSVSIQGGDSTTGTLTLTEAAPSPGVPVALSSNSPAATVAPSVTIPAGQTSVQFLIAGNAAAAPATATITAAGAGSSLSAALNVTSPGANPPNTATVSSITIPGSPVVGGQSTTGTVTLAGPAPAGGATIGLASNTPLVTVPPTVSIPQDSSSATFPIDTQPVGAPVTGTITATGSNTVTLPVSVIPPSSTLGTVSQVTLNPPTVTGGDSSTGTITLASPAGSGGVTATITSNIPSVTTPATVTVPPGATSVNFPVNTTPVSSPAAGSVTVTSADSVSTPIAVIPAGGSGGTGTGAPGVGTISGLSINPSTITGGEPASGTVTLASPAGAGGVSVSLSSSNPNATVPATVTVPQGSSSATFPVNTSSVTSPSSGNITATSANSMSAPVTVNPSGNSGAPGTGTISGLSINPPTVTGGQPASGTVTLASPAGAGGVSVGLSSSNPSATVPATVNVPQGSTSATFPVTTSPVTSPTSGNITATSANSMSAPVTVNPSGNSGSPGTGTISGISVNPPTITGGQSASGTVTLASPAGAGGVLVGLSSSNPNATVPATVNVPQGSTSATFPVTTSPVMSSTSGNITATSANSMSAPVTVNPSGNSGTPGTGTISGISVNPPTITGGQSASGTVTLASTAGAGGVSVGLSSSNPNATVPATVTVPQGATSATFPVTTSPVTSPTSGNITATSANAMSAPVTVTPAAAASPTPAGVTFSPASVTGGQSSTGTVTLSAPAPAGGAVIQLSSHSGSVSVPASVTATAGQSSVTFTASTTPVASNTQATISATSGGASASGTLAVNAPCPAFISATVGTPTLQGVPLTVNATLNGAAPSGGVNVGLTSGSSGTSIGSITVPAGKTSASTNLTVANALGLVGGAINALSGSCPLIQGTIH
jgi:sugar lactone lactonase YvrE